MSDSWQGLGWWQASDGKWYPPGPGDSTMPPLSDLTTTSQVPSGQHPPESHHMEADPPVAPAPLIVPELPGQHEGSTRRRRPTGPTALILCALLLLVVGGGSAVGIHEAMTTASSSSTESTSTTMVAGPTTTTQADSTSTSLGDSGVPPTTDPSSASPGSGGPPPSMETGSPGDLVTQAVAQDVLASTWAGFAHAMLSNDRSLLTAYTTPSALNDANATLDCGCITGPMTYSSTAISTPPQSSYPLSFLADLSGLGYNQQSQTWVVVFTKTSPATPWLIAIFTSYAEGNGLDGYVSNSTSPSITVHYPLQDAPQAYADFFQSLDSTLDVGNGVPANYAHDNILNSEVARTTEINEKQQAAGLHNSYTHSVDQVSPVFAQVVDGSVYGEEECFSVAVTDDVTSTNGSPIIQPENQSNWGYRIPPGSYSALKFKQEDAACVGENPISAITLASDSGGSYSISTTPGS